MVSFGGLQASAEDERSANNADDTSLIQLVAGSLRRSSKLLGVTFPKTVVVLVINCIDNVDFVRELYNFLTNTERFKCLLYVWQTTDKTDRSTFLMGVDFPAIVYWNIDELSKNVSKLGNIIAVTSSDWRPHLNSQILQKVVNCMDILNNFYLNTTSKRYNLPLIYKEFSDGHEIAIQETVVDWVRRITKKAGDKGLVLNSSSMEKDDFMDIIDGKQPLARQSARPRALPQPDLPFAPHPMLQMFQSTYNLTRQEVLKRMQSLGYKLAHASGSRAQCLFFAVNNALVDKEENDSDKANKLVNRVIAFQQQNLEHYGRQISTGRKDSNGLDIYVYEPFDKLKGYGQTEEIRAICEILQIEIFVFATHPEYNQGLYADAYSFAPTKQQPTKTIYLINNNPTHFDSFIKI
jgi:hypothetical protein